MEGQQIGRAAELAALPSLPLLQTSPSRQLCLDLLRLDLLLRWSLDGAETRHEMELLPRHPPRDGGGKCLSWVFLCPGASFWMTIGLFGFFPRYKH